MISILPLINKEWEKRREIINETKIVKLESR